VVVKVWLMLSKCDGVLEALVQTRRASALVQLLVERHRVVMTARAAPDSLTEDGADEPDDGRATGQRPDQRSEHKHCGQKSYLHVITTLRTLLRTGLWLSRESGGHCNTV
jgi:hypothetical protein